MRAAAASGDEKGKADLEAENVKLKAELSSLPELKKEVEHLRARVTELSRLSGTSEPLIRFVIGSRENQLVIRSRMSEVES